MYQLSRLLGRARGRVGRKGEGNLPRNAEWCFVIWHICFQIRKIRKYSLVGGKIWTEIFFHWLDWGIAFQIVCENTNERMYTLKSWPCTPFTPEIRKNLINSYTRWGTECKEQDADRWGQPGCIERHLGKAESPPESWAGEAPPDQLRRPLQGNIHAHTLAFNYPRHTSEGQTLCQAQHTQRKHTGVASACTWPSLHLLPSSCSFSVPSHLLSAPPVPGGVLPGLRHDHLRVWPAGPLEEEWTEEASPAVLGRGSINIYAFI